jgi:hypothetical protein
MAEDLDDLGGSKLPEEASRIAIDKKGIQMFFGEKEATFFDSVGKEMTINILQESFILYRIDLKKTKTHALYGEAIVKEVKDPIEIFGRINVEAGDPTFFSSRGLVKQGMGMFTASLHLSHLQDIGLLTIVGNNMNFDLNKGDYISHKGQMYEIWDNGYSQISNQFSYGGDRRAFLRIRAKEVDRDTFNAV